MAILLLTGCGKHPLPDFEAENEGGKPIEFGISSDFSVESKAAIDGTNYTDYGFIVQAGLTVASEKTETWKTNTVFGSDGTEVTYGTDGWGYSPARYWQYGSYSFAGAMPSSAGFTASLDAATHKQLTLHFGEGGYDLRAGQDDIMVGFKTVDVQSASSAPTVNFNFEHQLALVVIKGASLEPRTSIRIDKIEVYGNNFRTVGDMTFYQNGSSIVSEYVPTGPTSRTNVFQTLTPPAGTSWILPATASGAVPQYTTLVPGLLVFPEACEFSIIVTYSDYYGGGAGIQSTKTGTLSVDWQRGMKHEYTFGVTLDDITFAEPTMRPWLPGDAVDTEIQM